jgi:hypothetical protein
VTDGHGSNHHLAIDDPGGVASPDGQYIQTQVPGSTDQFNLTTQSGISECQQITVRVNGFLDDPAGTAQIRVDVQLSDNSHVSGSPFYVNGSGLPGHFTSYQSAANETVTRTLTGLTLSQADVDGLKIGFTLLDSFAGRR